MKIKKCCKECKNKGSFCSCYLADQCNEYVDDNEDVDVSFDNYIDYTCNDPNYIMYKFRGIGKWFQEIK